MRTPVGFETMSSALPEAVNYHHWVTALLAPQLGGEVLEVGVGYGQYSRELAQRCDRLVGVDIDPECVDRFQSSLRDAAGVVADLQKSDFVDKVGASRFDAAVCLNVLEHLRDDVGGLRSLREALKPGGSLCLLVPAHSALFGPMDTLAGHHRRYTRGDLARRLSKVGFTSKCLRYINPIGGLGWWVNAKFNRTTDLSDPRINKQILVFDRWLLPLSRALGPLTHRLFGQSIWAVAERS